MRPYLKSTVGGGDFASWERPWALFLGVLFMATAAKRKAGACTLRKRHHHKYHYITFLCELQDFFGVLYFFYIMNKNILWISSILVIAIQGKMCYTVITTEEVHANGKVSYRLWSGTTSRTQRDLNTRRETNRNQPQEHRARSEHESQCVVRQIKVMNHSPFTIPCRRPTKQLLLG